jgi:hypothetical protein
MAIVWTESEKFSRVKILDRYDFLEFIMKFMIWEVPSIYWYSSF